MNNTYSQVIASNKVARYSLILEALKAYTPATEKQEEKTHLEKYYSLRLEFWQARLKEHKRQVQNIKVIDPITVTPNSLTHNIN